MNTILKLGATLPFGATLFAISAKARMALLGSGTSTSQLHGTQIGPIATRSGHASTALMLWNPWGID